MSRKYGITLDIQVLRFIPTTLMYESMSAQLNPKIDFVDEYQKFTSYRAEKARQRVSDAILDQVNGEAGEQMIIRMDRLAYTLQSLLIRLRHSFSVPTVNFNSLMSKWSFGFYVLFRYLGQMLSLAAVIYLITWIALVRTNQPAVPEEILKSIFTRLKSLLAEITAWVVFPALFFLLMNLPGLLSQTKMLLGQSLSYKRTPKGFNSRMDD